MWKPGQLRVPAALAGVLALLIGLLAPADAGAQATALDPCQLVTSSEASSLAGAAFDTGLDTTEDNGARLCVYGSQTLNVLSVVAAQAPDADTAQASWSEEEAAAQRLMQQTLPPGVSLDVTVNDVSDLPSFDRAAVAQASATVAGRTLNISAIYLLKGSTFV